jgi:hypothetical protein
MFGRPIKPCRIFIWSTPESWWRSLAQLSQPPGPIFSNHVCDTLFCPNWTTRANACRCSFSTHDFCVITAWFDAVRFTPVPPTLGVVTNTKGFHESMKSELHFCPFIIAHFCIHVEYVHMIRKILR